MDWVLSALRRGWTSEEISGRLPVEFPDDARMRVGVETLYAWIYSPQRRDRQLWQYLPRGHKSVGGAQAGKSIPNESNGAPRSTTGLPKSATGSSLGTGNQTVFIGVRGTGALHTTVERLSRFLHAAKLAGPTAQATREAQIGFYQALPTHAVASVTADNGLEFAFHH